MPITAQGFREATAWMRRRPPKRIRFKQQMAFSA
jgi:hypothetical protein